MRTTPPAAPSRKQRRSHVALLTCVALVVSGMSLATPALADEPPPATSDAAAPGTQEDALDAPLDLTAPGDPQPTDEPIAEPSPGPSDLPSDEPSAEPSGPGTDELPAPAPTAIPQDTSGDEPGAAETPAFEPDADAETLAPAPAPAPEALAPEGLGARLADPAPAALLATARLSGYVIDGGTGLGAPSVVLAFYRVVGGKLVKQASATTNAQGIYTSPELTPGAYKVKATPPTGANIQIQFCGDYNLCESIFDTDNPIPLTAGTTTYGDFVLPFGFTAEGKVSNTKGAGIPGTMVKAYVYDSYPVKSWTLVRTATANSNGDYSFTGLPSGSYVVRYQPVANSGYQEVYFGSSVATTKEAAGSFYFKAGMTYVGDLTLRSLPVLKAGTLKITGAVRVGETATATTSGWPSGTSFGYTWLKDGVVIAGATSKAYTLRSSDAGRSITVRVKGSSATNAPTTVTSAKLTVGAGKIRVGSVSVTGSARVAGTLTVTSKGWSPSSATLTYRWNRNGAPIKGATGTTYKLTTQDHTAVITATVTARKTGYSTISTTSSNVKIGAGILTQTGKVTITGTAKVGSTVRAQPGTWGPGSVTLSYRWNRDGAMIKGATGRDYRLTSSDKGKKITVTITARRTAYLTASKTTGSIRPS